MSALADRVAASTSLPVARRVGIAVPLWLWVVGSRLLVLFAGTWGAAFGSEVSGWRRFDPAGISASMGSLGNLLGAASVRWDSIAYLTLARHGYTTAHSTVLFPLYPLLVRVLTPPGGSLIVTGIVISLVAFAVGLLLVHRITRWQLGQRTADATVLLIAFGPFAFVFSAVYTASLMFACIAGTFYLARQQRFVLASVVAACGALTHVDGVLLAAPLLVMYWRRRGCPRDPRALWSASLPALALPLVAFGGFFTYLHVQGWGWLAPITNQNTVNAGRTLVGPPLVLLQTVKDVVVQFGQTLHGTMLGYGTLLAPPVQNLFYLAVLAIAIFGLIRVWRRLPIEYAIFATLAILVCTSSAVAMEPLKGFDRYMLPIFPLWIGLAIWVEDRKLTPVVVASSSLMLVLYTIDFTRWLSVF